MSSSNQSSSYVRFLLTMVCAAATPVLVRSQTQPIPLTNDFIRPYDGSDGNPGAQAGATMKRILAEANYPSDGSGERIVTFPNPRTISNIAMQTPNEDIPNARNLTDFVWAWGQFLDHDLTLTPADESAGTANIFIRSPIDPMGQNSELPFMRSLFVPGTGTDSTNPRQFTNLITSVLDASMVYGHNKGRCDFLRTFAGGRLKTYDNETVNHREMMPPLNTGGFANEGNGHFEPEDLFVAGDLRTNEQLTLLSLHTLFVREHNRLCHKIGLKHPDATDEEIFQFARKVVTMEIQRITYNEWLPALLGKRYAPKLRKYRGYSATVDASIALEFAGAAFRFGHSMISGNIPMMSAEAAEARDIAGSIDLQPMRDSFFPHELIKEDASLVDRTLMGLSSSLAQEVDLFVVEDVRSFLFGNPGEGGLDLAALNIQRGRDLGLGTFNDVREAYGLDRIASIEDLSSNVDVQRALHKAYSGNVDHIELWVGCLAEDHRNGSSVGPTLGAILFDQFDRLMHGDEYFHLNDPDLRFQNLKRIMSKKFMVLSNIIRLNTKFNPPRHSKVFVRE